MNAPQDPNTPEVRPQVDERRRRFTQGGLAAPIVMGTLLSRPVLGAAPHNCTISGQLSGNVSTHVQGICSSLGKSPEYWRDLTNWPGTVTSLVQKNTLFTAKGFTDTYWKRNNNQRLVAPNTSNSTVATFQEVLANTVANNNPPTNIDLGRAAIASYLNAIQFAPNFPLSTAQVVAMFNATINGGTYPINPSTSWTAAQVLAYFRSLYQ
ncbi:MAG: hypothetical protein FJ209_02995 [Betaproteobacteria bacterium]|nr:hypothetical protein [Betaproteobacteria bacterium]